MLQEVMLQIRIRRDYQRFIMVFAASAIFYLLYTFDYIPFVSGTYPTSAVSTNTCHAWETSHVLKQSQCHYNARYPLSLPERISGGNRYQIAVIADLDEERSKVPDGGLKWRSYLKKGFLTKLITGEYTLEWGEKLTLTSKFNEKGRGFELSELCVFNGNLYSIDDRTGIVYHIKDKKAIPWVILMDGDGSNEKGFKGEWLTVRDGALFVGGIGKEWTTRDGTFLNYNPLFVKSIDQNGAVMHHNWTLNYLKIRASVNIKFPGYMIHEAVMWSPYKQRWYFLPRRMSELKYDDMTDERRGTNVLISADSSFNDIRHIFVAGKLEPTHGFSSFKFIPGSNDNIIVALKTKEVEGDISTYMMVFETDSGKVLMNEKFIENNKYEGIEFI